MGQRVVVVKIGSSSLTHHSGEISIDQLRQVSRQVSYLKNQGYQVLIVSSAAVACGFRPLGLVGRPRSIREKQAAAAVGQGILIQHYRQLFQESGTEIAQVLLTRGDFTERKRYMNALNTLSLLLEHSVVPIINENDSVSVDEIRWGDNDYLAAQVAGLLQAEWLVLVTTADGVYTRDPTLYPDAQPIPYLDTISSEWIDRLEQTKSQFGSGGMRSKLEAARYASEFGVKLYVGRGGRDENWLDRVLSGNGTGTYIGTQAFPASRKHQWIGFHSNVSGRIAIDQGAAQALGREHRSLLPCGVVSVEGNFQAGDVVEVVTEAGKTLGRGIVNFSDDLLQQTKGLQSDEITAKWPIQAEEVIHRDNWVQTVKR